MQQSLLGVFTRSVHPLPTLGIILKTWDFLNASINVWIYFLNTFLPVKSISIGTYENTVKNNFRLKTDCKVLKINFLQHMK